MTLPTLSLFSAVRICAAIAGIGIAYNAAELFVCRRELLEDFFNWRIVRSRYYILIRRPVLGWVFDALLSTQLFIVAVVFYGVAGLLFPWVIAWSLTAGAVLAAIVVVVHAMTHVRLLVGMDGSDQMQTVVWTGLFFYCLPLTAWARTATAGFIAAQLVISYMVSGWAKLISPMWRRGSAVREITRTATYCTPTLSRYTVPRSP